MATIPDIKNRWQYEEAKARIETAKKAIEEAGGFMDGPKTWIHAYSILASKMLAYEIDRDLIPELL